MEILVDVAVDLYGEVARTIERERQRIAFLLSLYSVGIRTNLETLDILSNTLYLNFNFTFKFKLSYGCDLYIVLGISHPIHLEGVGVDVFPISSIDTCLHLEVFLQFNACWCLAHNQAILGDGRESHEAER